MKCECCGQTIKVAKVLTIVTDTLSLSTADAYAYFKKTAPVEDAKFLLRSPLLTDAMRGELESLIARPPARAEFYRRYINIQDAWRQRSNEAERIDNLSAVNEAA
jgi:hypothetical protein